MPSPARPDTTEYAPFYQGYVSQVPDGDVLDLLERQLGDTIHLLGQVPEERAEHRYAEGKWSIKEVAGHIVDTERVFAYRVLCFARGDAGPLPGFDENTYVANGGFAGRTLRDLVGEFVHVRRGNLHMFRGFDEAAWAREGIANGKRITVRALPFIMAGHERHHVRLLRERYLQAS
jgi:hypothetical protein